MPLTSAAGDDCNLLLVANQLWFGFLASGGGEGRGEGHPRLMGHATPSEVKFIGIDFCCCCCIESV